MPRPSMRLSLGSFGLISDLLIDVGGAAMKVTDATGHIIRHKTKHCELQNEPITAPTGLL